MATTELLPLPVAKGLSDRLNEKRKSAALEIERYVRNNLLRIVSALQHVVLCSAKLYSMLAQEILAVCK